MVSPRQGCAGYSPPESGGDASRSEAGAVCSKFRVAAPYRFPRSAPNQNRCASRTSIRSALTREL